MPTESTALLYLIRNLSINEDGTATVEGKPVEVFTHPATVEALQGSEKVYPVLKEDADALLEVGYMLRYLMKAQGIAPVPNKYYRKE